MGTKSDTDCSVTTKSVLDVTDSIFTLTSISSSKLASSSLELSMIVSPTKKLGAGLNDKVKAGVVVGKGSPPLVKFLLVEDSIMPPLLDNDIAIVGAFEGDFFISVM